MTVGGRTRCRAQEAQIKLAGRGLALFMICCLASCGKEIAPVEKTGQTSTARPNVLLIVVDTLRRDHLSCYGHETITSPAIDALARESVVYSRAYSQAPWTTPSIGSLLSSRYPTALGIKGDRSALAPQLFLLPEALQAAGYETAAVVSHSFCSSRWGFAQGFSAFDESNVLGHSAVTSEGVTERGIAFLESRRQTTEPWFLWLHYFDPHCAFVEHEEPSQRPESYTGRVRSGQLYRELWQARRELTPEDYNELRRLYKSEIRHTDAQIGRVLEQLKQSGALDNTIVVLTADHGEEFGDHGSLGHARTLYEELIGVPLMVRFPGVSPTTIDQPVALIDVYPTLLAALELKPTPGMEGIDIRPNSPALDQARVIYSETNRGGRLRAAIAGDFKLIARGRFGQLTAFDLKSDPKEARPLDLRQDPRSQTLVPALAQWWERVQAEALPEQTVELTGEDRSQLEQLGYGGDESSSAPNRQRRKD